MSKEGYGDDLVFEDETPISVDPEVEQEIYNAPKSIVETVESSLTPAEKDIIEKNKRTYTKRKMQQSEVPEKKKTIEEELVYSKEALNGIEYQFSLDLQDELITFIKDKVKIAPGTGVKYLLPTGIDLMDAVAGGGFAAGALTLIVGNPGTFKSALLGQTIATSQKKYRGKVLNAYLDSEEAMTSQRLQSLGVKYPPIKPYPASSVEDVFKTVEAICSFKDLKNLQDSPSIIALDSLANTITEKEKASTEMDINKIIGLKARVLSVLLPRYIPKLQEYNIGLIVVNQLREKIDMGFFPTANDMRWIGDKTIPGGNALKYNAFHMLLLRVKGDLKPDEWGFNGVLLEAKFVKNKLFTPNIVISLVVDFNKGVSNFWTNWQMLVDKGRATSSAWCSLVSMPQVRFRKKEAILKYNSDPNFKTEFDRQVKEVIQIEYINKYSSEDPIDEPPPAEETPIES